MGKYGQKKWNGPKGAKEDQLNPKGSDRANKNQKWPTGADRIKHATTGDNRRWRLDSRGQQETKGHNTGKLGTEENNWCQWQQLMTTRGQYVEFNKMNNECLIGKWRITGRDEKGFNFIYKKLFELFTSLHFDETKFMFKSKSLVLQFSFFISHFQSL